MFLRSEISFPFLKLWTQICFLSKPTVIKKKKLNTSMNTYGHVRRTVLGHKGEPTIYEMSLMVLKHVCQVLWRFHFTEKWIYVPPLEFGPPIKTGGPTE